MPPEALGRFTTVVGVEAREVGAYVLWLDDPAQAIGPQLPEALTCPECGSPINLTRFKNQASLQAISVSSFSCTCATCYSTIHFDRTPASDRPSLTWVDMYRRA